MTDEDIAAMQGIDAVSYTHLDVYKRQMAKFLESGCMHVFAVSGMHVGVAAMLVLGMLRLLHVRPRACLLYTSRCV